MGQLGQLTILKNFHQLTILIICVQWVWAPTPKIETHASVPVQTVPTHAAKVDELLSRNRKTCLKEARISFSKKAEARSSKKPEYTLLISRRIFPQKLMPPEDRILREEAHNACQAWYKRSSQKTTCCVSQCAQTAFLTILSL